MTDAALRPSLLPELELHAPTSIEELTNLVAGGCHPIGGATDVLLSAAHTGNPRRLALTAHVPELTTFAVGPANVTIGGAVTLGQLIRSADFISSVPALAEGAHNVGSTQLRNSATLVGNLCTASPAGDTIPGQFVQGAVVEVAGPSGSRRSVPVRDFTVAPGRTSLGKGEVVTSVRVERCGRLDGSAYRRFTERNAIDLAFASVAARVWLEADGETVKDVRLALGAVGPTVIDASAWAAALVGLCVTAERLDQISESAALGCAPISDHRCSADYRRQLVRVLVAETIELAVDRAHTSNAAGEGQS
ncbi:MAG: hypothetical protein GY925_14640 [Actinomycetia bacterium]|nr:hypothetical protein [Actinomycetes bacterium]